MLRQLLALVTRVAKLSDSIFSGFGLSLYKVINGFEIGHDGSGNTNWSWKESEMPSHQKPLTIPINKLLFFLFGVVYCIFLLGLTPFL